MAEWSKAIASKAIVSQETAGSNPAPSAKNVKNISYAALKLFTGKGKEVSWLVYLLASLFILRFVYLKAI